MRTERIKELKLRINWLANQGIIAARSSNRKRSLELLAETYPLMTELAELLGNDEMKKMADKGANLHREFTNRRNSHGG